MPVRWGHGSPRKSALGLEQRHAHRAPQQRLEEPFGAVQDLVGDVTHGERDEEQRAAPPRDGSGTQGRDTQGGRADEQDGGGHDARLVQDAGTCYRTDHDDHEDRAVTDRCESGPDRSESSVPRMRTLPHVQSSEGHEDSGVRRRQHELVHVVGRCHVLGPDGRDLAEGGRQHAQPRRRQCGDTAESDLLTRTLRARPTRLRRHRTPPAQADPTSSTVRPDPANRHSPN